jgi:hypothetical protein
MLLFQIVLKCVIGVLLGWWVGPWGFVVPALYFAFGIILLMGAKSPKDTADGQKSLGWSIFDAIGVLVGWGLLHGS